MAYENVITVTLHPLKNSGSCGGRSPGRKDVGRDGGHSSKPKGH